MANLPDHLNEKRRPPAIPLPRAPELARSQTTPGPPTSAPVDPPSGSSRTRPPLRKRHSTYIRPTDRASSPIPELPPHRPPRNPARASTMLSEANPPPPQNPKPRRPSTATRDDVTPWEFQAGPTSSRVWSAAPSVKSKASSLGLSTGPVEEVTPWELFPAPVNLPSSSALLSNGIIPQTLYIPSMRTLQLSKPTGLVEDVTPWELFPEPLSAASTSGTMESVHSPKSHIPTNRSSRSQPASLLSVPLGHASHRLSMATGPTEDVAPWELEPPPEDLPREPPSSSRQRNSLTMSKAQLEEVMPWELYPVPPLPANAANLIIKNGVQSARQSTSSTKTLGDLALLRRRRSTGSRPPKPRSNSHPKPSIKPKSQGMSSRDPTNGGVPDTPRTPKSTTSTSEDSPMGGVGPKQNGGAHHHRGQTSTQPQSADSKFTTADRTILEELKRNIRARNDQFVIKGAGVYLTDGTLSPGKKHHPFVSTDVPYPRSYEREVIDLDVWETLFCQDICESLTWHVFEEPPGKVLDIGCGTGTWILNCARQWRETHFVGLDIVPLHPDLQQVGSNDLASRITWTQANFLDTLPFPDDEFDFVHIKRIALGVPEDKWDALFDEISRIMKPGGALEVVEEDLFFPGKPIDREDDEEEVDSALSRRNSLASATSRHEVPSVVREDDGDDLHLQLPSISLATTPTIATAVRPPPPGLRIVTGDSGGHEGDTNDVKSDAGTTTPPGSPKGYITIIPPHSRSSARPLLYIKTNSNNPYGHSFAATRPPKPASSSSFSNSTVSLLTAITHHSQSDSDNYRSLFRGRRSSSNIGHPPAIDEHGLDDQRNDRHQSTLSLDSHHDTPTPFVSRPDTAKPTLFLLRTPATPPTNPRDHSLLEYIYNETLSSRFINSSPISLLTTYLEYHFKDARTHPPLLYTFPPLPSKVPVEVDSPSEDDGDNSPAPLSQAKPEASPIKTSSSRKSTLLPTSAHSDENGELLEQHRWLTMQGLLQHASPYVHLDKTRSYSFSPAQTSTLSVKKAKEGKETHPRRESRMPNKTFNIDLRTLNLHLTLRAKEIIACSETMWEWVRDTQLADQSSPIRKVSRHSLDMGAQHSRSTGLYGSQSKESSHRMTVLSMNREDFNQALLNFEMDMQDQASLHTALRERFQWVVIESSPSQNRKIFNTACEKYDKWMRTERRSSFSSSIRPSRSSLHAASIIDTPISAPSPAPYTRNRSNSQTILLNPNRNGAIDSNNNNNGATHFHPMAQSKSDASVHFALPKAGGHLPPTQKLSRSMCVFVAWKPEADSTKS